MKEKEYTHKKRSHKQGEKYDKKWFKEKKIQAYSSCTCMHAVKTKLNELNMNIFAQRRNIIFTHYAANHRV